MICPKCNSVIPDGARFCTTCGYAVPAAPAPVYDTDATVQVSQEEMQQTLAPLMEAVNNAQQQAPTPEPAPAPEPVPAPQPAPAPQPVYQQAPQQAPVYQQAPQQAQYYGAQPQMGYPQPAPAMNTGKKGKKVKEPKQKKRGLGFTIFLLLLTLALIALIVLQNLAYLPLYSDGGAIKEHSYKTAEAAAKAYFDALSAGDANKALSTFAKETYAENVDVHGFIDAVSYYSYERFDIIPVSESDEYSKSLLADHHIAKVAEDMLYQHALINGYDSMVSFGGVQTVDSFIDDVNKSVSDNSFEILGRVEIDDYLSVIPDMDDSDKDYIEEEWERKAEIYGADEVKDIVYKVKIGDSTYYLFIEAANYGGKWFNTSLETSTGHASGVSNAENMLLIE